MPLSRGALGALAWANEIVEAGPGDREFVDLLARGNFADPSSIASALGRPPLNFAQSLSRQPASIGDLWRARLYFLQPLLRLTLDSCGSGRGLCPSGCSRPPSFT